MRALPSFQPLFLAGLAALMTACASDPQARPGPAPGAQPGAVVAPPPATAASRLTMHEWELVAMADSQGRADTRWRRGNQRAPRLHFEDGRMALQGLCNTVASSYRLQGPNLALSQAMSTKRACADRDLMALEDRMARQMNGSVGYEVRSNAGGPPLLVLLFADGSRWELTGEPTAQTRYGGQAERVFLEVAPQRVPCHHGTMANAQCLRVREVRFADNGVRQGVGEWRPLYGEIEGYTHQPGTRHVLRLNRFQRAQPVPADASAQVYVLDMVVETERMR